MPRPVTFTRQAHQALEQILHPGDIAVDGAVGPATRGVLRELAASHGVTLNGSDPKGLLLTAAQIYWVQRPTRPDLF